MSYSTVIDILKYSQDIHQQASALFAQLREETQRERVDMMLKLLAHHEERLAIHIGEVKEASRDRILKEWHQFEPESIGDLMNDCKEIHPDISVEELISITLKLDDFMIETYRQLASEASSSEVRQLFSGLAEIEEAEKISAVRAALSANDW